MRDEKEKNGRKFRPGDVVQYTGGRQIDGLRNPLVEGQKFSVKEELSSGEVALSGPRHEKPGGVPVRYDALDFRLTEEKPPFRPGDRVVRVGVSSQGCPGGGVAAGHKYTAQEIQRHDDGSWSISVDPIDSYWWEAQDFELVEQEEEEKEDRPAAIALINQAPSGEEIADECKSIMRLLLRKNIDYGNSAMEPLGIFSDLGPEEGIRLRIDDKLKRLKGPQTIDEDTIADLIGYLVLLRIVRKKGGDQ